MVAAEARPNLYLIGFMGVGKTAVGRAVARALGMRFIDSDWQIEKAAGCSIADIFARDGEAAFRRCEVEFIEGGHARNGLVVSCGGGLPTIEGMPERLRALGVVVCLFARPETIIERTRSTQRRPLLNVEDPEARVRQLLALREPIYMQTGIGVTTDGRGIHDIVKNVVRIYRREVRLRARAGQGGKRVGERA